MADLGYERLHTDKHCLPVEGTRIRPSEACADSRDRSLFLITSVIGTGMNASSGNPDRFTSFTSGNVLGLVTVEMEGLSEGRPFL
jgi:hypothetical protein